MRSVLLVLLGFGVFAGYGSAIASARWHARNHGGGCESRWNRGYEREEPRVVAAPAPQTVIVPQAAPAAAVPAQQIFLIMPGAQAAPAAAPQVVTIAVPAAAAPLPAAVQAAPASP